MLIITEPSVRSVALQPRADAATQRHRSSASHTACVMMSGASASAKGEDRIASIVHRALISDASRSMFGGDNRHQEGTCPPWCHNELKAITV